MFLSLILASTGHFTILDSTRGEGTSLSVLKLSVVESAKKVTVCSQRVLAIGGEVLS